MKLTETWRIEKSGESFNLVQIVDAFDNKGKPKKKDVTTYYGTLYQALQAYLTKETQKDEEIYQLEERIQSAMKLLEASKDKIKEEFCIEVRSC